MHEKWSKKTSLSVLIAMILSVFIQSGMVMAYAGTRQPVINPNGGSFSTAQEVSITNIADGDSAYYTTDGSNPTTSSTAIKYDGSFTVSETQKIRAAVRDEDKGWSAVVSVMFYIDSDKIEAPVISPNGGSFSTAQEVSITNIADGDSAYYTTDGSNPTTSSTVIQYSGSFTVSETQKIRASVRNSEESWSIVVSAMFYINSEDQVEVPVISPDGGSFDSAQDVSISNIDAGNQAYYTLDGSNPITSSTARLYGGSFTVDESLKVRAAVYDSDLGWSSIVSASFVIDDQSGNSSSDKVDQLKEEFAQAIKNNNFEQALRILAEIKLEEKQGKHEDQLNEWKEKLIDAVEKNNWNQAEAFLKKIIKEEGTDWAYSQLGQIFQKKGNKNISVFSNGDQLQFDVQPIVVNGRTMIPIGKVATAMGLSANDIKWDPSGFVSIKNGSDQIRINVNSDHLYLNGKTYSLDVPAQICNGRMMIPLRAVGQLFNKKVQWYPQGSIVSISNS